MILICSDDFCLNFPKEKSEDKASQARDYQESEAGMIIFADDSKGFVCLNVHFVLSNFLKFGF